MNRTLDLDRDMRQEGDSPAQPALRIALTGNPNCGKTALFNTLTGGRQKVANYAGVTIERKVGTLMTPSGRAVQVLDLPGAYSLHSVSPDERITREVLLGRYHGETPPDLIVCVADATNLRLHLRFVLEVRRMGRPMVLALNMMDEARRRGILIDIDALSRGLGMEIVPTIAVRRDGARDLVAWLDRAASAPAALCAPANAGGAQTFADLHAEVRALLGACVTMQRATDARDDAIDRVVLHPVLGLIVLALVMFLVFQAVYSLGKPMTDLIGNGFDWLGDAVSASLPGGPLRDFITHGLLSGLGTVLGFLPEILVLFFFILVLEESGYLPRAAFLLDYPMLGVGLTGRSFIPLLSSFACAIPGVMATRSITDRRDRLATILVAPLMTCSARLPVYALLIAAFIPERHLLGVFNLQGMVLFALYAAGIGGAMLVAWIFKRLHLLRLLQRPRRAHRRRARRAGLSWAHLRRRWKHGRAEHALLMELPSYRVPKLRDIGIGLWERCTIFLKRLTGVILALTVLMWFVCTFPAPPAGATGPAIDYTIAGYLGRILHHVFAPLGFNWQISLALIPAFAARETAVSALATTYAVSDNAGLAGLAGALPAHFSLATALSLMVWFAFAPQCMSTLAIIRRETRSWKNVMISFCYMFVMAYVASLLTYQVSRYLLALT